MRPSLKPRGRLLLMVLPLAVCLGALVVSVRGHHESPVDASPGGSPPRVQAEIRTASSSYHGIADWTGGLSAAEILDQSLSHPGVHGLVRGVVGMPSARELPNPHNPQHPLIVTDYPLIIRGFLGPAPTPYIAGRTITVRVPGGRIGERGMGTPGTPDLSAGSEIYVFVLDRATFFDQYGRTSSDMVLAINFYEVFHVRNGIVYGRSIAGALIEPVAVFERHFVP